MIICNLISVMSSNFFGDVMNINYDVRTFILKKVFVRRSNLVNFAYIKIGTRFIKRTFKDSRKFKKIRKYLLKWNYICIS